MTLACKVVVTLILAQAAVALHFALEDHSVSRQGSESAVEGGCGNQEAQGRLLGVSAGRDDDLAHRPTGPADQLLDAADRPLDVGHFYLQRCRGSGGYGAGRQHKTHGYGRERHATLDEVELPLQSFDVRTHPREFTLDGEYVTDGYCPVEQFQQALLGAPLTPEAGLKVDGLSRDVPLTKGLSHGLPQPSDAIERVEESVAGTRTTADPCSGLGPPEVEKCSMKPPNDSTIPRSWMAAAFTSLTSRSSDA